MDVDRLLLAWKMKESSILENLLELFFHYQN